MILWKQIQKIKLSLQTLNFQKPLNKVVNDAKILNKTYIEPNHKTIITIALLLFFYPVGVVLMYKWTDWSRWIKVLIALPLLILIAMLIFSVGSGIFIAINSPK